MKAVNIYLIVQVDDTIGDFSVISGSTNYEFISQEYGLLDRLDSGSGRFKLMTIKLPEIILNGDDTLIDLMPPTGSIKS
mgnify:CR=1 FL=1